MSPVSANIQNEFGVCGWILTILSYMLIIVTLPISACMCIKVWFFVQTRTIELQVVQEYERAVIFRLGRLMPGGAKGPGIFLIVPCIDTYRKVDLRVLSFEVPPQEILSKDSVTVAVDAVVYFRISNATISVSCYKRVFEVDSIVAETKKWLTYYFLEVTSFDSPSFYSYSVWITQSPLNCLIAKIEM